MVVLDKSECKDKLKMLPESGVYEPLSKDPATRVERKVQQLNSKHKTVLPIYLKCKLTPYDHIQIPQLKG